MEIIVDGETGLVSGSDWETIADALEEIEAFLKRQGRGMLALTCDGKAIAPERLQEALADKSLDDIESLEVLSEDLKTLAGKSLAEMDEVLPELAIACHGIAELFQSETPEAGFEKFEQLAEIWATVKERQQLVARALGLKLGDLSFDGNSVAKRQDDLNRFLSEAAEALEAQDLVSLGDLLEYELAPRAEEEQQIVALLRTRLEGESG